MVCLGRPYHFKFFKGSLPQILLRPFLNNLTHMMFQLIAFQPFTFVRLCSQSAQITEVSITPFIL